jgi:DNA-binding MarR family transcriptional regulator
MTEASDGARTANLLAAFALAATERTGAATATSRPATDTAALVALTTFLAGTPQDGLARVLGLTQSGATRLVDRLAREGLAERTPGPDGRTLAVVPTAAGRALARRALVDRRVATDAVLSVLAPGERAQLAALLEKLLAGLTGSRADAWHICRMCDPGACEAHPDGCPVTRAADAAEAR